MLAYVGEDNVPDSHAKEHPRLVLLVSLHRTAAPQGVDEVALDDLNRLVATGGDLEGEFPSDLG